jgi:hypothetical protein
MKVRTLVLGLLSLSAVARADENKEPERPRLARQIGIDFKNVFTTKENLLTLGLGTVAAGGSVPSTRRSPIAASTRRSSRRTLSRRFSTGAGYSAEPRCRSEELFTHCLGKLFIRGRELGRDLVRAYVTQSLTRE